MKVFWKENSFDISLIAESDTTSACKPEQPAVTFLKDATLERKWRTV